MIINSNIIKYKIIKTTILDKSFKFINLIFLLINTFRFVFKLNTTYY